VYESFIQKIYGGKDDPRLNSVLVSASYAGVQIDVAVADDETIAKKFGLPKVRPSSIDAAEVERDPGSPPQIRPTFF
jgi:hypothetical protein